MRMREIALAALAFAAPAAAQTWIQSPVNGHWYAKTANFTWTQAEAVAQSWGGHLASVESAQEDAWIYSTFGGSDNVWIGLHREPSGSATWVWADGSSLAPQGYTNWAPNQPDHTWEDFVEINCAPYQPGGHWNDLSDISFHTCNLHGVVELISDDCDQDGLPDLYETAVGSPVLCPVINSVSATSAQNPTTVVATGAGLDSVVSVTIGGVPGQILLQSYSSLSIQPQPSEPGFPELVAAGSFSAATKATERWPSLAASTTGIGGTASVGVRNGTAGIAVVAYAAGLLPAPGIALPPTWSTLKLDIAGPYVIVASYGLPTSGELDVAYPVPNDPSLAGSTAHIQAWCQQGFFGPGVTYSFTNAAAVTF